MRDRGRHTTLDASLKPEVAWLESRAEVSRVILGLAEACRHAYAPGTLRPTRIDRGGFHAIAYSGNGIMNLFVVVDNENSINSVMELMRKRYDLNDPKAERAPVEKPAEKKSAKSTDAAALAISTSAREIAMFARVAGNLEGVVKSADANSASLYRQLSRPYHSVVDVIIQKTQRPRDAGYVMLTAVSVFDEPGVVLSELKTRLDSDPQSPGLPLNHGQRLHKNALAMIANGSPLLDLSALPNVFRPILVPSRSSLSELAYAKELGRHLDSPVSSNDVLRVGCPENLSSAVNAIIDRCARAHDAVHIVFALLEVAEDSERALNIFLETARSKLGRAKIAPGKGKLVSENLFASRNFLHRDRLPLEENDIRRALEISLRS